MSNHATVGFVLAIAIIGIVAGVLLTRVSVGCTDIFGFKSCTAVVR